MSTLAPWNQPCQGKRHLPTSEKRKLLVIICFWKYMTSCGPSNLRSRHQWKQGSRESLNEWEITKRQKVRYWLCIFQQNHNSSVQLFQVFHLDFEELSFKSIWKRSGYSFTTSTGKNNFKTFLGSSPVQEQQSSGERVDKPDSWYWNHFSISCFSTVDQGLPIVMTSPFSVLINQK